ncbi:MAG TPA: hypothetical protein VKM94_01580 [Blastocatellia bacterium]|nr:hypothetical protein [Blastocatellia bacterium]
MFNSHSEKNGLRFYDITALLRKLTESLKSHDPEIGDERLSVIASVSIRSVDPMSDIVWRSIPTANI